MLRKKGKKILRGGEVGAESAASTEFFGQICSERGIT